MKKEKFAVNWKDLGVFLSHLNNLFVVIREVWAPLGIGLEIIEWLLNDGRKVFIEEFLKPLGEKAIAHYRVLVVNTTTIRVNLNLPPTLMGSWMRPGTNNGSGWVEVQRRGESLHVNGRKLSFYQSEQQKRGEKIYGEDLALEVKGKEILHPNIIDGLLGHQHLIPDNLKFAEDGEPLYMFFIGATHHDGAFHKARCLCWRLKNDIGNRGHDDQWSDGSQGFTDNWGPNDRVAILEPEPVAV